MILKHLAVTSLLVFIFDFTNVTLVYGSVEAKQTASAKKLYEKALKHTHPRGFVARFRLNLQKGKSLYLESSRSGYNPSKKALIHGVLEGTFSSEGIEEFNEWLLELARDNDRLSQIMIGELILERNIPSTFDLSKEEQAQYVLSLARDGNRDAQYNLGWRYDNGYGVPKDDVQAVEWYKLAAKGWRGNKEAEKRLGEIIIEEKWPPTVSISDKEKIQCLLLIAESGNTLAQYMLGKIYERDPYGIEDINAAKWYAKAAKSGHIEAQESLERVIFHGERKLLSRWSMLSGLEKAEYLLLCSNNGHAEAQYSLGMMYENGDNVPKNDRKALELYKKSALGGYAQAQFKVGFRYAYGCGVLKSDDDTIEWYRKSAQGGYAHAQHVLGSRYAQGRGVLQNDSEAVEWYKKAAAQGHREAQYDLGGMYETGRGVLKSSDYMIFWYTKAANQGHTEALYNLGWRYANGYDVLKNDKMAIECYKRAATKGHTGALYELGVIEGRDNVFSARRYFEKAARQGHREAQYSLGYMYLKGHGAFQNDNKAVYWFKKAAIQEHEEAQTILGRIIVSDTWPVAISIMDDEKVQFLLPLANRGHSKALFNLGLIFANNQILNDDVKAVELLKKAAAQGYAEAKEVIAEIISKGRWPATVDMSDEEKTMWSLPLIRRSSNREDVPDLENSMAPL